VSEATSTVKCSVSGHHVLIQNLQTTSVSSDSNACLIFNNVYRLRLCAKFVWPFQFGCLGLNESFTMGQTSLKSYIVGTYQHLVFWAAARWRFFATQLSLQGPPKGLDWNLPPSGNVSRQPILLLPGWIKFCCQNFTNSFFLRKIACFCQTSKKTKSRYNTKNNQGNTAQTYGNINPAWSSIIGGFLNFVLFLFFFFIPFKSKHR